MKCRCIDKEWVSEERLSLTGLIFKYHGSRGVFRSMVTSS